MFHGPALILIVGDLGSGCKAGLSEMVSVSLHETSTGRKIWSRKPTSPCQGLILWLSFLGGYNCHKLFVDHSYAWWHNLGFRFSTNVHFSHHLVLQFPILRRWNWRGWGIFLAGDSQSTLQYYYTSCEEASSPWKYFLPHCSPPTGTHFLGLLFWRVFVKLFSCSRLWGYGWAVNFCGWCL